MNNPGWRSHMCSLADAMAYQRTHVAASDPRGSLPDNEIAAANLDWRLLFKC